MEGRESFEGWTFEQLGTTFVRLEKAESALRETAANVPNHALDGVLTGIASVKNQVFDKIRSLPEGEFVTPELLRLQLGDPKDWREPEPPEHSSAGTPGGTGTSAEVVRMVASASGPPAWGSGLDAASHEASASSFRDSIQRAWREGGFHNGNDLASLLLVAPAAASETGLTAGPSTESLMKVVDDALASGRLSTDWARPPGLNSFESLMYDSTDFDTWTTQLDTRLRFSISDLHLDGGWNVESAGGAGAEATGGGSAVRDLVANKDLATLRTCYQGVRRALDDYLQLASQGDTQRRAFLPVCVGLAHLLQGLQEGASTVMSRPTLDAELMAAEGAATGQDAVRAAFQNYGVNQGSLIIPWVTSAPGAFETGTNVSNAGLTEEDQRNIAQALSAENDRPAAGFQPTARVSYEQPAISGSEVRLADLRILGAQVGCPASDVDLLLAQGVPPAQLQETLEYLVEARLPWALPSYYDFKNRTDYDVSDALKNYLGAVRAGWSPATSPVRPSPETPRPTRFVLPFSRNPVAVGLAVCIVGALIAAGVCSSLSTRSGSVKVVQPVNSVSGGDAQSAGSQPSVGSGVSQQPTAQVPALPALYPFESLSMLSMTSAERDAVSGPGTFNPTRTNVTDPGVAFSSLPVVSNAINTSGGRLSYNADQATAPTTSGVFGRQNSALWFPGEAAAAAAVGTMVANYPALFQDYVRLATPAGWNEGHCFTGRLMATNAQGQTSQTYWAGCALQQKNVAVASYFGSQRMVDANTFLSGIAGYHSRVDGVLRQTASSPANTSPPAQAPTATPQGQPATATPAAPPPTATPPPAATSDRVANFAANITAALPEYASAVATGNGNYLFSHLDPSAIRQWGEATCRDYFSRVGEDPTFKLGLNRITGPETWLWQIYGLSIGPIPDVYTLNVSITQRGQTTTADVHLAWDAQRGQLRIFSPCIRAPGT